MSWVDYVIIALVIAGVAVQAKRGFLQSLLDLVGSVIAVLAAKALGSKIPGMGPGTAFWLLYGVLLVLLLLGSRFVCAASRFTLEGFDPVLGGFFGLLLGLSLGHGLTSGLVAGNGGEMPAAVEQSRIGIELQTFSKVKGIGELIFGQTAPEGRDVNSFDDLEKVEEKPK